MADFSADKPCRILSLDGGGAKGFYTLGVLREIEGLIRCPLHETFDLIFGTSTGAIIAALLALGKSVKEISDLYEQHVPTVMQKKGRRDKSLALATLGDDIFKEDKFDKMKTGVGIVATRWVIERPMIFKTSIEQAHGRMGTFSPGFGERVSDAVQASCSAFPFFERKTVKTDKGDLIELIDGGYCANNPTLYAIADATMALKLPPEHIRVLSLGVGVYPAPKQPPGVPRCATHPLEQLALAEESRCSRPGAYSKQDGPRPSRCSGTNAAQKDERPGRDCIDVFLLDSPGRR